MDTTVKQRVCGLLGGVSYVSTLDYYSQMNELVGKSCPGHGSRIHIVSLDVFSYVELLDKSQWSEAVEFLLEGVGRLVKSGIDFLLICSNTSHIAAPKIAEIYPDLVFIHIGDAVAVSAKQKKLKKLGFLGTKFAMVPNSCVVERLVQHDLVIELPKADEIEFIHRTILEELTNNRFIDESRQYFVNVIQRLFDEQQVEGVILGCTEIPLLVKQNDIPQVPLLDSSQLHIELAVDYQLGRVEIDSILPRKS